MTIPHPAAVLVATLTAAMLAAQQPVETAADKIGEGYELVDAFPGQADFERPIYLDHHASDPGIYYVMEQGGRIWRIPSDGESGERHLFADLTALAYRGHNEEGLLGFAFHPDYPQRRQVFAYYSRDLGGRDRDSVLARFDVVDGDGDTPVVDPGTRLEIMTVDQPWGNHNGGTIVFGPDGMMYVALGDGGAANDPRDNGQDLGTLVGSILRIDVRNATADEPYRVPDDNPFVGREGARGEIWAYGLRNPWRIAFDRETGELWCGDVGQNLWEEVDRIVAGGNYGWNIMEGTHEFELRRGSDGDGARRGDVELIPPVAEYHHREGVSVTGGYVYRGRKIPELVGQYVYGDFATTRIWSVREDREGGDHVVTLLIAASGNNVASFAEEPDGELLVLNLSGRIDRLVQRR